MPATLRVAAVAAALFAALPVLAQEEAPRRFGLGVGMNTSLVGSLYSSLNTAAPAALFYLPMQVTPAFRLEPSLGWISQRDDEDDASASTLSVGLGAFAVTPVAPQVQGYFGGRLVVNRTSSEDDQGSGSAVKTEATNLAVAATGGAEYLLAPSFAVGLEVQVQYLALGGRKTSAGSFSQTEDGGHAWTTDGFFFLRAYLF